MTTEEALTLTIETLERDIDSLRDTNRSLNRRANAVESPWRKEVEKLKVEKEMYVMTWVYQFGRTGEAFEYLKRIYEACATEIGLPRGRYSSINDCSHAVKGEPYTVRVAVIHENGTVEVHRVLDVVIAAIARKEPAP